MTAPSHNLHIELAKKLRLHLKSQDLPHKSEAFLLGIPIARDVGRLLLRQQGIENRLLRQPWRKLAKLTGANEIQLSLTRRPVPFCQLYFRRLRIRAAPSLATVSRYPAESGDFDLSSRAMVCEFSCTGHRTTQLRVSNPTECPAPHAVFPRSTL